MDNVKISEALKKADEAKALLSNPLLQEVFERLEVEYVTAWKNSAHGDSDQREVAYFRLQALDQVKNDLESLLQGGKVAEFNNRSKRLSQNNN